MKSAFDVLSSHTTENNSSGKIMPKYRDAGKSELDSQRALLDSLMGMDRNADKNQQQMDYRDDRVCKFFLTGMCPHGKLPFP
jgi:hypothetical protein